MLRFLRHTSYLTSLFHNPSFAFPVLEYSGAGGGGGGRGGGVFEHPGGKNVAIYSG